MSAELNASHGTVEGLKDTLAEDLDLLKDMVNSTADEFAAARSKIEGNLVEARSRIDDARLAVTEKGRGTADAAQVYVREKPWTALGVVAAAGLIIGFLLSRR
ncbi:MAG: hypothetical protein ABWY12_02530 [Burkholderiales bacterium]